MNHYNADHYHGHVVVESSVKQSIISNTFLYLWLSLLVSFGIALWGSVSLEYNAIAMILSALGWLALVFIISRYWTRMNYQTLMLLYLWFVVLEWYWLSGILMRYPQELVTQAFIITAGTFFVMSIIGHQMKINLLKRGAMLQYSILWLIVAWFVLIIASFFWAIQWLSFIWFILSILGVVLFCAFIIYDINELKELAETGDRRVEIVMAMSIYLTFINLFINILRILGYVNNND